MQIFQEIPRGLLLRGGHWIYRFSGMRAGERVRARVAEGVGKGGQTSKNKSGDLKGFFSPILEKLP